MAKKKVEPGHIVVTEDGTNIGADSESTTALDDLMGENGLYQTDMAPLAAQPDENANGTPAEVTQSSTEGAGNERATQDTSGAKMASEGQNTGAEDEDESEDDTQSAAQCTVILKKGSTFRSHGIVYAKNVPVTVAPEVAKRLLGSGMFEKG